MIKKCNTCKEEKPFKFFFKDKNAKDGYGYRCKDCSRQYNDNNPKNKEYRKKYYLKNRKSNTRFRQPNGFIETIPKETFIQVCNDSLSMAEASRKLKISSFAVFKTKAVEYGCYKPNQSGKGIKSNKGWEKEINEYKTRSGIRKRIIDENLLEYKCQECGLSDNWNNKTLVLHLDHINGVNDDHRLENLRWLCPNCHSQTDTYAGRNSYK